MLAVAAATRGMGALCVNVLGWAVCGVVCFVGGLLGVGEGVGAGTRGYMFSVVSMNDFG